MYGRIDAQINRSHAEDGNNSDYHRLESLSFCQKKLLLHAMKFPGVKKIVYSTCSIYSVENEDVVAAALGESEQQHIFRIKTALPNWPHRLTNPKYPWAEMCISADYNKCATDGFFVAVLEKIKVKKGKSFEKEYYEDH